MTPASVLKSRTLILSSENADNRNFNRCVACSAHESLRVERILLAKKLVTDNLVQSVQSYAVNRNTLEETILLRHVKLFQLPWGNTILCFVQRSEGTRRMIKVWRITLYQ